MSASDRRARKEEAVRRLRDAVATGRLSVSEVAKATGRPEGTVGAWLGGQFPQEKALKKIEALLKGAA